MAALLGPTARLNNRTEDVMIVTTVDVFGYRLSEKRIESGGFVDLEYREGIDRIGPQIIYLVRPENRGAAPKPIMPIQVFKFADIDISYELSGRSVARSYEVGAVVHFQFRSGTTFGRIGLVRRANSIISAIFGNCCSAAHVPNLGEAANNLAVVEAPGPIEADLAPVLNVGIDIPSAPQAAAPTPRSEIELGIN